MFSRPNSNSSNRVVTGVLLQHRGSKSTLHEDSVTCINYVFGEGTSLFRLSSALSPLIVPIECRVISAQRVGRAIDNLELEDNQRLEKTLKVWLRTNIKELEAKRLKWLKQDHGIEKTRQATQYPLGTREAHLSLYNQSRLLTPTLQRGWKVKSDTKEHKQRFLSSTTSGRFMKFTWRRFVAGV